MSLSAYYLHHRALIKVSGTDKLGFLQGLVSNDLSKLSPENSLFCLLLSPQGRFQYDLLIHQVENDWFIEIDQDRAQTFIKRLTIFKLRSDVTLDLIEDKVILAVWGGDLTASFELEDQAGLTKITPSWTVMIDPRLPELGARLIVNKADLSKTEMSLGLTVTDLASYQQHRYKLGVPEGANEIEVDRAIPLEWGMDDLNAIDWDKGCYMGQELTARTRYRGLVRKRIVPCYGKTIDLSQPLISNGKEVGQWITHIGTVGLAMIRVAAIDTDITCNGQAIEIKIPSWIKLPDLNDEA